MWEVVCSRAILCRLPSQPLPPPHDLAHYWGALVCPQRWNQKGAEVVTEQAWPQISCHRR